MTDTETQILDGKLVSTQIKEDIRYRVEEREKKGFKKPHLAAILVGDNPASQAYISNKIKS